MPKLKKANYRKRDAATVTPNDAIRAGLGEDTRDPNVDLRPPRVPMGQGLNLDTGNITLDDKNYYHRWFLDSPDKPSRIPRAKAAYYEYVESNGKPLTRPAGNGLLYLMRLPWKYRNQDLLLKKKKSLARMDEHAKIKAGEYAPDPDNLTAEGGRSAVSRDTSENPYS